MKPSDEKITYIFGVRVKDYFSDNPGEVDLDFIFRYTKSDLDYLTMREILDNLDDDVPVDPDRLTESDFNGLQTTMNLRCQFNPIRVFCFNAEYEMTDQEVITTFRAMPRSRQKELEIRHLTRTPGLANHLK